MRIILVGPPGSGKGTQAHWISQQYGITHLGMGDMLRKIALEPSSFGQKIATLLKKGQLVPDTMAVDLIKNSIAMLNCQKSFILDGFPRTIKQAQLFNTELTVDLVIEFSAPDAVIISRLKDRRIHLASGRIYHMQHNPPQVFNQDDVTKEPLVQRSDDTEPAIKERLVIYHKQTLPVINYYQKLSKEQATPQYYNIASCESIEKVRCKIKQLIAQYP